MSSITYAGQFDLFVAEDSNLFPTPRLSDLGQTTSWLLDVQVKPWLSRKRQAAVRVSDLLFTRRSAMVTSFAEQVEDLLNDVEVPYTPNVELEGRFGKVVRVDFLTSGARLQTAILTLSSGSTSQAHVSATEVFQRWYDLDVSSRHEQRLTVLDDRADVYREDDIQRLRDLSDVVALSDRQTLQDLLLAA